MKPALRLNGSSDLTWERIIPSWADLGLQRYDYTKIWLEHRKVDPGYRLVFSYESEKDAPRALSYLAAGHSVAAVVPEDLKHRALLADPARHGFHIVDGDEADTRFLDPPGSLVLLKPKGHIRTGLLRPKLFLELREAARATCIPA